MLLSILNDAQRETSDNFHQRFGAEAVLARLRAIDDRARRDGLAALDPAEDSLITLGTETDAAGHVTKNSLGVFDLSWQAVDHPEWPQTVAAEIEAIRENIRATHSTPLRFLIWAGMGGSIEDKSAYQSMGLLKGGPRFYALDSTDPAKLRAILDDMQRRSALPLADVLRGTLVVGMAMGMTSYEPVVNLEKLAALYQLHQIDSRPNFIYMTLPGSILDQFAAPRGYRRIPLQLDGDNTTAGRHSGPLTRGSLYPLAFAGADLKSWIAGTFLNEEEVDQALKLAAFLHAQGIAGCDKISLLLPKSWAGLGLWTKQDFEESLGKSEQIGLKIVIHEKVNLRHYHRMKDSAQDRVFLVIQKKGEPHPDAERITDVRHGRYPMAIATFSSNVPASRYMQFIHYVVFGLAYLRNMNFVTQPGVELYKTIAGEVYDEAKAVGGVEQTPAWKALTANQKRWRGVVSLHNPETYASMLRALAKSRQIEYGELTFFGDLRYSAEGQALRKSLDRAGDRVFRARLKMPSISMKGRP